MHVQKFNLVGVAISNTLKFLGILYLAVALAMGICTIGIGMYNLLNDIATKYGHIFWTRYVIGTSCIGIGFLVIVLIFGPAPTIKKDDG